MVPHRNAKAKLRAERQSPATFETTARRETPSRPAHRTAKHAWLHTGIFKIRFSRHSLHAILQLPELRARAKRLLQSPPTHRAGRDWRAPQLAGPIRT